MKETAGTITNPSDGSTYTASSDWNSKGTQLGTSEYYCIYNGSGNTVTVTNLSQGTLYVVQAFEYNGTLTGTVYNISTATGNPNSQATLSSTPTLIADPTSLSGFTTDAGTVSGNQTYSISGSSLTPPDDFITITAPTNFEVSSNGTNYYSSVDIPYSGDVLNSTTIYVRIASTSSTGNVSGNVSNDGGGVSSPVNVAVSGFVYAASPTTQPTSLSFSNITHNSLDISWTAGNGTNTIVLMKSGSAVNSDPVKGTSYNANNIFGSGDQIGTGNYVMYNSTGTSVSVTGLSANTTYYIALYSFNGSGTIVNYLLTSPLTGNQITSYPPATTYTWTGASSYEWTTAANWSPSRTTPSNSDILQFNSGNTHLVQGVPNETIGRLIVSNNTVVNFQTSSDGNTLTISGGTGVDLNVEAGSQLNINDPSYYFYLLLAAGTTGTISGNMTFSNKAHKLTATDTNGITFNNGSFFTAGTSFSGNAFGTTNLNSVVFASGSTYVFNSGGNPFGAGQPSSVVVFQTGSLYKHSPNITNLSPSFSGRTYANFEYDANGISTSATGSSPVSIENLTITSGTFNFNVTGTPGHSIKGNISVSNSATLNFSPASAGTTNINGSSAQYIANNGTLSFGSYSTINISNSNGLTLNSDVTFNNLTMTSGNIFVGNNKTLKVNGTYTNSSPSATNMIVLDDGTNSGTFSKRFSGTGSFTFPVGDSRGTAEYSPVDITFNSGTFSSAYLSVQLSNTKNASNASTIDYLNRYWTLTPTGISSPNYNVTLNYVDADISGTETNLYFGKLDGVTWTGLGIVDYANNKMSATELTAFSTFTGGEQGFMPVELSSFTANINERNVNLNWTTATEINNSGFEIQRSDVKGETSDGWTKVTFVNGNGTKNTPTNYSFEDKKLNTGKYNYRLKQIDYNGNFEYFNLKSEVEIGTPKKFEISQNYPNPFNPSTKIDVDLPFDSKVMLKVYDISGREIKTLINETKQAGYYTVEFNNYNIASGVYFYRINAEGNGQNFVMTKKMLMIK